MFLTSFDSDYASDFTPAPFVVVLANVVVVDAYAFMNYLCVNILNVSNFQPGG